VALLPIDIDPDIERFVRQRLLWSRIQVSYGYAGETSRTMEIPDRPLNDRDSVRSAAEPAVRASKMSVNDRGGKEKIRGCAAPRYIREVWGFILL
jgi:hypothetical protein